MAHMQHDGGGGGTQGAGSDGLISPLHFPCRAHDLDVAAVSESASTLQSMGESVRTQVDAIGASWDGLQAPSVYQGPEQAQVYALMEPAESAAGDLEERFTSASTAMQTYAEELAVLRPQLVTVEEEAWEFRAQALAGYRVTRLVAQGSLDPTLYTTGPTGDPVPDLDAQNELVTIPWREHEDAVARNAELVAAYNRILERISTAATDCANAIQALLTGGCTVPYEAITAEQFLAVEGGMPYGAPVAEVRNCTESTGDGLGNWWHNTWTGAASLIGRDPSTEDWSLSNAGRSWFGVADFLGSTALVLSALTSPHLVAFAATSDSAAAQWLRDRANMAAIGWGSLIGWDHQAAMAGGDGWHRWQEDGVATGTEVLLNGAMFFIPGPGWAAAGVRVGTTGARAAALVSRLAAGAAEFVIPAGSWVVHGGVRVIELSVGVIRTADGLPFPTTAANAAAGGIRITPYSGLIAATGDTAAGVARADAAAGVARTDAPTGPPPSTRVTDVTDFGTRPDPTTTNPTPSGVGAMDADGTAPRIDEPGGDSAGATSGDTPGGGNGAPSDGVPSGDGPAPRLDEDGVASSMLDPETIAGLSDEQVARIQALEARIDAHPWSQAMNQGNIFDIANEQHHPLNQFHVTRPGSVLTESGLASPSQGAYNRLDSADLAAGYYIERKFTQLSNVQESTAIGYVNELVGRYGPGRGDVVIADTPSNRAQLEASGVDPADWIGEPLDGRRILEVPVQQSPPPLSVVQHALAHGIQIRDVDGTTWGLSADGNSVIAA